MKIVTTNKVKARRETAGLTQTELAEKVGTKRITIASLEREKYEPSVGTEVKKD